MQRFTLTLFILLASTLLWPLNRAAAQTYNLQRYNTENGLPEPYVYTINQDERGFLYVGTGAGLFRFNGQSFLPFTKKDGLAENFTTASLRDSRNRLWFGHFEGGITLLDGMRFRPAIDSNLLASSVNSLIEDDKGNIWACTQRSGLIRIDSTLSPEVFAEPFKDYIFTSMAYADGRLAIGTDAGVLIVSIAKGKPEIIGKAADIPSTGIRSVIARPKRKGIFWVGTEDEGLWELSLDNAGGTAQTFGGKEGFPWPEVTCLYEEPGAKLWMGAPGNGFITFDDHNSEDRLHRIMPTAPSDTLAREAVKCFFQDRFGQLWIGTYGQGLLCLSEETLTTVFLQYQGATIDDITVTLEDRSGNFWFGTPQGLFYSPRHTPEHFNHTYTIGRPIGLQPTRVLRTTDGLPSNDITALFEDKDYNLWVGTRRDGVAILDPSREEAVPLELSELALSKSIHAITQDKKGMIWIGTTDGAFRHNPASSTSDYFSTRNGLAHNNILDIHEDKQGRIWFITHTNRITILDKGKFELLSITVNGEAPNVNCMAEDKEGIIWLGTDGMGLYRYDGKGFQQFSEANGLFSNYIYHIKPDRYGNLWLGHSKGLTRYIPATGKFLQYPNKDHLQVEENPISHTFIDRKGNIWFGSEHGAIRYNWIPARSANQAPFTFISSIEVPGYEGDISEGMELPYDNYRIRVNYLGLTFLDQDLVRYQYKILGFADEWSDPAETPGVTLQGLPDGTFTFMVRACNALGNCNEVPAKFTFTIRAPFWKTLWFRALAVILLAAIIYSYVRYRTYRLNMEKMVLEQKVDARTAELKAAKEKVENANLELEKLSLVASKTDNAVFILDNELNLVWVNDGFTRLTGYNLDEFLHYLPSRNLLAFSSNKAIGTLVQQAIDRKVSVQYESQLPTKAGDFVWVISTLTTVHDDQGALRNIIIIDSNISERKQAEEAVRRMNAELEALVAARTEDLRHENEEHKKTAERLKVINKELDTFVYRASHDLKGPLASLLGLISISISELEDNEKAMKYLPLMDRAGKRLDTILTDLIDATELKQAPVERANVEVEPMVRKIIDGLRTHPDFDKMHFDLHVTPGLSAHTDPKQFQAILFNFIQNTLKYRDPAKPSSLCRAEIAKQGDMLTIKVTDNGLGIPANLQSRVFDMFFRGSKIGGGSGLGLYIVHQAAEKLGGTVGMESKEGEGSSFWASIPA